MVFPEDFEYDEDAAEEHWDEMVDIAEDEQIDEGDITVSETRTGHDPMPSDDDIAESFEEELDDEGMHIMDEDEFEMLEDPYDADGYLDDEDEDY